MTLFYLYIEAQMTWEENWYHLSAGPKRSEIHIHSINTQTLNIINAKMELSLSFPELSSFLFYKQTIFTPLYDCICSLFSPR